MRSFFGVCVCLSLFLSFIPIVASAAETGARGIEEVVVTARRREETAQSVPIPVTAVTGDELIERAGFDIRDLERVTPNLTYINSPVATE